MTNRRYPKHYYTLGVDNLFSFNDRVLIGCFLSTMLRLTSTSNRKESAPCTLMRYLKRGLMS